MFGYEPTGIAHFHTNIFLLTSSIMDVRYENKYDSGLVHLNAGFGGYLS